ncbi:MAG: Aspartyl/glutamyl-tRNA(Asn/Gln) amidotransferase subunit C [Candidatus Woesebacteria bacterium GW2011_GWB1_38_5b]|uniref:Aspartyl/glutamyl-tRNA(Asn/Gln) amidotransferase subunit C n=2 Tax=Candidatus Woeseibacteriota TaxID=1752722 RepID=A0A0G0K887_9BACT|nr:MAG: Aspartyl/glutamyl-tRNA(Asn/Gln) amidotransferase subunit C [Candidatus Woesebacteria bacterium GW2011_GWB1_38_5b]OGM19285.1 MAG: hypothetical protein A2686_04825 [Candidatus Woesebacteria bacterium RIFCSPHIGHO2_01_FULL_38_10]OGM59525.1 MAG: hypothetical protein A2892_02300 [Candidatus Woesebacteria bacterium RIFCSPLOWO2_01_FULL_39_10b]
MHIAKLANLQVKKSEVEKFSRELSVVISYFDELNGVDTSDIQPTSQTTGLENVLREDDLETEGSLNLQETLSGTESICNDYFKVPGILEERSDK